MLTTLMRKKKQAFSKLLLERLNQGGWEGFDERFVPAVPISGNRFIGLQIEKYWIDTRNYAKTQNLPIVKKRNSISIQRLSSSVVIKKLFSHIFFQSTKVRKG